MPCGCGKKNLSPAAFADQKKSDLPNAEEWGPILWKYLHCLTEKIGRSGNKLIDADQANYIETLITTLHLVLPCTDCQTHAATYISKNPFPSLKELTGERLRQTVCEWLFTFHNQVRIMKGQPIMLQTIDQCAAMYTNCFIPKCEYTLFIQNVAYAARQGWVRIENWRKWYSNSERLRLLVGNVVV